ncbi:hypothetical protein BDV18DRAFT_132566 [Aspergillus unguis]
MNNNTFARALARALPSFGRQCQPRASFFGQTRPFSSTPKTFQSPPKDRLTGLEEEILGTKSDALAEDASPVSAITKGTRGSVSADYSRMVGQIEEEVVRNPYGGNVPAHHLHVMSHRRNTLITLTRPNGSPLMSMGTGVLGFRKARRGGYDPGFQLSAHVFSQIQERGLLLDIKAIEIVFRGFHQGRQAFVKALLGNEGKNIRGLVTKVSDSTRLKFGGTRSPRTRRL